jgi:hypothetical protein
MKRYGLPREVVTDRFPSHPATLGEGEVAFEDAGEQALKNIARPVRVWRWSPAEPGRPAAPGRGAVSPPLETQRQPIMCALGGRW